MPRFTKTEQRVVEVLKDGKRHRKEELKDVIDELCSNDSLKMHMSNIRRKLNPLGEDIVCVYRERTIHYQWVRLISYAE